MAERRLSERIIFHNAIETTEVDFSDLTFTGPSDVDAFYDEADRALAATGRRWYFLIVYQGCSVDPAAWSRFTARGQQTSVAHGLGTVRLGASEQTRKAIREHAGREMFRANMFATRDQAMFALGEMRKRTRDAGDVAEGAFLRVENIHLRFGGVRAITGVGFHVNRGEISSIIGPNGAGKSSMLNIINGVYRPQTGTVTFLGQTHHQMRQ